MSRRTLSSLAGLGAALMVVGALAGCATGGATSVQTPDPSDTAPQEVTVDAAWLEGGASVAVLLEGSSTCVPMADDVTYADGTLSVSLLEPADDTVCTRDLVLRGIPISLPSDVDATQPLAIKVTGDGYTGATELAGVSGLEAPAEEGAPSAGWASTPGTFALLTYGSSTCLPVLEGVAVSAPGEIAVTFATPPADQVCTADYAPRVTVVDVTDAEPGTAYTATLSGDAFEAVSVAIAGTPA